MKKFLLSIVLGTLLIACTNKTEWNIQPSGEIATDTIPVQSFHTLLNNSSVQIELDSAVNENEIILTGDKNFIENLEIKNENNQLNILNKKSVSFNTKLAPIVIKMNNSQLEKVTIAGSGSITTKNMTLTKDIAFLISGTGEINVKLQNNNTSIEVNGLASVNLEGESTVLKVEMPGAGNLDAENLKNKQAFIEISGTGNAKVNTTEAIDVQISGIGNLNYKAHPQLKITKEVLGIGNIDTY
ncbi:MAG TPA: head GIN domain-containing protein [Flavobacterium sp.]|nr:head GIN domain-containing protein [Flavobacterium sp.]